MRSSFFSDTIGLGEKHIQRLSGTSLKNVRSFSFQLDFENWLTTLEKQNFKTLGKNEGPNTPPSQGPYHHPLFMNLEFSDFPEVLRSACGNQDLNLGPTDSGRHGDQCERWCCSYFPRAPEALPDLWLWTRPVIDTSCWQWRIWGTDLMTQGGSRCPSFAF